MNYLTRFTKLPIIYQVIYGVLHICSLRWLGNLAAIYEIFSKTQKLMDNLIYPEHHLIWKLFSIFMY
jgi:hypothetical protein